MNTFIPHSKITNLPEKYMEKLLQTCEYYYFNDGISILTIEESIGKFLPAERIFPAVTPLNFIYECYRLTKRKHSTWINELAKSNVDDVIEAMIEEIIELEAETNKDDDKRSKIYWIGSDLGYREGPLTAGMRMVREEDFE